MGRPRFEPDGPDAPGQEGVINKVTVDELIRMEITLFELHFDGDTSFGPTFGGDDEEGELEAAETEDQVDIDWTDDEDESTGLPGPSPVAILLGLVVLALVAFGVKKALGGGGYDDGEPDEFEPEMVEIEE